VLYVTTVVSDVDARLSALIDPLNWIAPPLLHDITIDSAPYLPILTVLSENASITGKPAAVLTLNNEPDNESSTENNLPAAPSTENRDDVDALPDPLTFNTSDEPDTCNLYVAFDPDAPIPTLVPLSNIWLFAIVVAPVKLAI
jgi:hypothetical protein